MATAAASTSSANLTGDQKHSSKKRKAAARSTNDTQQQSMQDDSRFKFSAEELDDDQVDADNDNTPASRSFSKQSTLPAHLLPKSATSNQPTPGLIYLSRIPPGMGPSKVKHLLGAYGEVGRVYLARDGEAHEPLQTVRRDSSHPTRTS